MRKHRNVCELWIFGSYWFNIQRMPVDTNDVVSPYAEADLTDAKCCCCQYITE